ncbi:MAG: glycosyltransferase [Synechococcales cyanobacterium C42_A2020_086]|jgi:glycosyltransferase involved in cell wall biosynthesis|nr:glycosyltransferase [Synechococcales cyanobacterium C42_A2020_086]
MSLPPLSVLMPVYNGARYLRPAVDSILGQTWRDFEFLILDDGSTDASFRILQGYAAQDARISVFQRPHRGIAQSRNELLRHAQGQWIACMDADDISLPERFARQIAFLGSHPEVVCVGGAIDWIDAKGNWLGHCSMPETDADLQRLMLGGISLLHHPCTMARRSALLQVGGYDETLIASADLDLWLRLGEIGKLANLPDTVLQYRLHRKSITHVQQHQQHQDALTACQRAWQRRGLSGTFIRQPADHLNQTEFWLRCGWQGFQTGQRDVAKRCGLGAIRTQPLSWTAWNLFLCAWLKPMTLQTST